MTTILTFCRRWFSYERDILLISQLVMGQYGTNWTQIIRYLSGFWVGPGSFLLSTKSSWQKGSWGFIREVQISTVWLLVLIRSKHRVHSCGINKISNFFLEIVMVLTDTKKAPKPLLGSKILHILLIPSWFIILLYWTFAHIGDDSIGTPMVIFFFW